MSRRTIVRAIAACAVLVTLAACDVDQLDPDPPPRPPAPAAAPAVLSPCDVQGIADVSCGSITVPLDREDLDAGTTNVGFALVPRRDRSQPSLGTIAVNPGGPGGSAVDLSGHHYVDGLAPILDRRDLLLIDPRGVGRSDPIDCPALDDVSRAFAGVHEQRAAIGTCGEQLGPRAGYYGTAAVADDFDDVRAALGIERLDLIGDSYGSFLMATYAQRHPDHVRSVVLSGAFPVNDDFSGVESATALRRAIGLVCDRTRECAGDTVLQDLSALAARLRAEPVRMDVEFDGRTYPTTLDEWQLAGAVGKLFSTAADPDAQLGVARAAAGARAGDLGPVRELVRTHLVTQASYIELTPEMHSDALLWAVTCHDYARGFDLADAAADRRSDLDAAVASQDAKDFTPFSAEAWITRDSYDAGACLNWPNVPSAGPPFPEGSHLPDVPTLVLAGDLDANTTSDDGRAAAAQFPQARFVEVENVGHTPTASPDGVKKVMEFIAAPTS